VKRKSPWPTDFERVPSAKVSRQVRGALNQGRTDEERIALVTEVLDEAGITAPPPREPLPDVEIR